MKRFVVSVFCFLFLSAPIFAEELAEVGRSKTPGRCGRWTEQTEVEVGRSKPPEPLLLKSLEDVGRSKPPEPLLLKSLTAALCLAESVHTVAHIAVLTQALSIQGQTAAIRLAYFSSDLLTSLLSYGLTRQNLPLVTIHTVIHAAAAAHLLGIRTKFFKDVLEMGELKFAGKRPFTILMYVLGTLEDIATHSLNAKALFKAI